MTAKVSVKVGPVSAKFSGNVTLSDLDPPNGYTISGEGKGGVAGFGKGGAKVRLLPEGDGTLLTYEVSASVGGKLAQIGARLIDATAKKMAEQFFEKFTAVVAARSGAAAVDVPVDMPALTADPAVEPALVRSTDALPPRQGLSTMTWVSLTTVIVLVILAFVMR
jgi:carbon monoxide dehydrogenase subunit G